jgi:tRNA-2-methylthio-N6-dimethylallyladenosine synthase
MRRGYTRADYLDAVRRLREAMPHFALTTDVIVGFPGETPDDFEQTRTLMDAAGFDNAFIFKYSPRPGTPAADMPDDVPDAEKMRRNQVLLEDQDLRGVAANQRLVGTLQEVLVEGPSLRNAARWSGRSPGNKIVIFEPAPGLQPGTLARVRITRPAPQTHYGDLAPCPPATPSPAPSKPSPTAATASPASKAACSSSRKPRPAKPSPPASRK